MIDIVFEDNHLLVLNKPSGLLTQPSGTDKKSLEELAKVWLKQKYEKPGNVFLEAIHRLDRAASGIVVFAKTSKALSRLMSEIRNKNVKKIYHALVKKAPPEKEGILEHYLIHDDYRATVVKKDHKEAKQCRLYYKVIKENSFGFLLEIDLETGRYHQIRAQLAAIGCPVAGDQKYGSKESWKGAGIALHHRYFEIPHPITKEMLSFGSRENWGIE
jgi:23S rRNA pseudouridine1911/1915/1917 synthase